MDTFAPIGAARDALRPKNRHLVGPEPTGLDTATAVSTTAAPQVLFCAMHEEATWNA